MLESGTIEYVVAAAQAASAKDVATRVGQLADAGGEARWMVQTILGNVVVLVCGLSVMEKWDSMSRETLVALLQERTGNTTKIIFGSEHLRYGNLGSESRMSYGVLLTRVPEIMAALTKVSPGMAERFSDG